MSEENILNNVWEKVTTSLKYAGKKISEAWKENAGEAETNKFSSIQRGNLDFDLLEVDIKKIQIKIELDGYSVLGSHLIIDDRQKLIEIKTYSQKGEKSFVDTVTAKVKGVTNIPSDILDELKSKGRVELSLKFDD
jgi:secreted Zn-dependent insulinase-like peptidase